MQVFCTKRNPNCMACPLRHECDYALANGQHLQPGLVRPKKATPRPKKPASRANAMLALPSADSASAGGMKHPANMLKNYDLHHNYDLKQRLNHVFVGVGVK